MHRYWHPEEFAEIKRLGLAMGFRHVESGPLVRSSYHADEQVQRAAVR
ncbi:Lipoyl synthase [bacterium HR31]|nr:Lipoyl synthase [bacterium HR31]